MLYTIDLVSVFQGNHVKTVSGFHGDKDRGLVPRHEMIDQAGEMQIGQTVGVIRKKEILSFEIFPDGEHSLADIGVQSRVREGDGPVVDVAIQQLGIP